MKNIYVRSESSNKVFKRIRPFEGTIIGKEGQRNARIVVSLVVPLNAAQESNKPIKWIKSDLVKISPDDYPEVFLWYIKM